MTAPKLIYPPLLTKGDTIAIAAPASPPDKPGVIDDAIQRLTKYGFRIKPGAHLRERDGYLAGSDEARAADINAAFTDPEVKAVFCLRGGYGSCRILPLLNYRAIRANPEAVARLQRHHRNAPGHPREVEARDVPRFERLERLRARQHCLVREDADERPSSAARRGSDAFRAERRAQEDRDRHARPRARTLLGGNFTCLLRLLGTPWQPDFRGAILFLEDTCEKAYRIDGMFTHLRLAGVLEQIGGLVLGQFDFDADKREQARIAEVLPREAKRLGVPCVMGAPIGHFPSQVMCRRAWTPSLMPPLAG